MAEDSILRSTKKVLGLDAAYTPFDPDIITYINGALAILDQLGLNTTDGVYISDDETTWEALGLPANQLNLLRNYVLLKVRMIFDPPTTSFAIEAMKTQISEFEWRLSVNRENAIPIPVVIPEESSV